MRTAIASKDDILVVVRENKDRIRNLGVRRLGLFGSFVRGDHRPGSDIDLLVEFEPGRKTFETFMDLSFLLEELLQRKVELVTPESLSHNKVPELRKELEVLLEKESARE